MTRNVRDLVDSLPDWMRSRWALTPILLLVVVPVVVSLLRATGYETTLEVFPTKPPGNAGIGVEGGSRIPDAVANRGFQDDIRGWRREPGFALGRSTAAAHSGTASLTSTRLGLIPLSGRAGSTGIVFPSAGRYRVEAWVHLPRGYNGGPPAIALEGFSHSSRVTTRAGDPRVRGRWQRVSSDYVVDASRLEGMLVLRSDSPPPQRGQVLHWDDIRVLSANEPDMPAPARVNLVPNPGFETDRSGWADPPSLRSQRSDAVAHSGSASLRASSDQQPPSDTNAGYTYVVFPRAGTYRARAWVYVPRHARVGPPNVRLEGFSGIRQLAQRVGDPERRGKWQLVWSDYVISSRDLEGALVLRVDPNSRSQGARETVDRETVVYWDDVTVSAPRPEPPRDALGPANSLRSALEEPQLRLEVSLLTDDDRLYDPRRATVVRSAREGGLSFTVMVRSDAPDDARRLAAPLRLALLRAGRRSALRRAQATWQNLISELGSDLPSKQREVFQRRGDVLKRMIGAPARDAAVPPTPAPEPTAAERGRQQRVEKAREKVLARLGEHLPPRRRAFLTQRAEDLRRMIATQATEEFVVLPAGRVRGPTRAVDRLLETLPGPFPPRVAPGAAGAAGLLCALLLFGLLVAVTVLRQRAAAHGG